MAGNPKRARAAAAGLLALLCIACSRVADERTLRSYVKAAAAYDSGDLDLASKLAKETLDRDGRFQPALVLLGKAFYFSGNDCAAITTLERAVRFSPRAGAAMLWLARTYRSAGRNSDAKRACERVLAADPENVAALRLAAIVALDLEDSGSAMAFLDRAAETAGETGMAFSDRAALRWAAGDSDGAIDDLSAAAAILPSGSAARGAAEDLLSRIREQLK